MKSYKNLPQSSQGYGGQSRMKNDDLVVGRTSSIYNGIPKPSTIHSAVSRQQQNSQQNTHHSQYNSTSAAGYTSSKHQYHQQMQQQHLMKQKMQH